MRTSTVSLKKQESSRKSTTSASLTTLKSLTVWITTNCGKFFKRWECQTTLPASWETCVQVKKQQLESDMKQWTVSKLGHLMRRTDSFEKTLMLGKIEGRGEEDDRGWDGWMASPTQWTWVWVNSRSRWWTGRSGVLQSTGLQRHGHNWVTELKVKAVYCHPANLTYTQSTSHEMLGWMYHKLESRLMGEISTTSDIQMIQP